MRFSQQHCDFDGYNNPPVVHPVREVMNKDAAYGIGARLLGMSSDEARAEQFKRKSQEDLEKS